MGARGRMVVKVAVVGFGIINLLSCWALRRTTVPVPAVWYHGGASDGALVVLLPGRADRPKDFEGFVRIARSAGIGADFVAVDLHMRYYIKGTAIDRLRTDVIEPARAAGYGKIWLVGVSMGGTGTLLYMRDYPTEVTGAYVVAPFLGDRDTIQKIQASGWAEKAPQITSHAARSEWEGWQWGLWHWARARSEAPQASPLYLGFGDDDRFARDCRLLAETLPSDRVFTTHGAHNWPTWESLWTSFLHTHPLAGIPATRS